MKKFILIFLIAIQVCFLSATQNQTAFIASFNAQRLGNYPKDYALMAKALSGFDVIGVVEVMNITGLENIVNALNKSSNQKWGYIISERSAGTPRYKEFYAFIWKTPQVKLIKSCGFYKEVKESDFAREPYASSFKIGNFDFIFVICHVIWGDKPSKRCEEVEKLPFVYDYFKGFLKNEKDVFIAGDFNTQPDSKCWNDILGTSDKIKSTITIDTKTTVSENGFVSSYDNILYNSNKIKWVVKSGSLDLTKICSMKNYRDNVSDHVPVYVEVKTDQDSD
jgi:hypothetical protein